MKIVPEDSDENIYMLMNDKTVNLFKAPPEGEYFMVRCKVTDRRKASAFIMSTILGGISGDNKESEETAGIHFESLTPVNTIISKDDMLKISAELDYIKEHINKIITESSPSDKL